VHDATRDPAAPGHDVPRVVIRAPTKPRPPPARLALHALAGVLLGPLYWGLAALRRTPGMQFRARATALGIRGVLRLPLRTVFHLLFMPMESTRYFEFDFAWRCLAGQPLRRYLDVSSPRLLPIALIDARGDATADLMNPDARDLAETRLFVDLIHANDRCRLHGCLVGDAPFAPGTFDVITSISVVEHISDDVQAVRRIWEMLKPGGRFVLTVPCMARAQEQFIDRDEFGLQAPGADGLVFWQRLYDQAALERRIFATTGPPRAMRVYGEKTAGALLRNSLEKRADAYYPYWREPLMMGREYAYFDSVDELPGEGVVGLLFEKPL
jgi:SAM-dependent methyltransferase